MKSRNFAKDILFGVSVGDALGVPVEFESRRALRTNPVTGMREFGTHNQPKGTWSDDSSLTFCLAESLLEGYNLHDIANKFIKWKYEGIWTPYGKVFSIGHTTNAAITKLQDIIKRQSFNELKNLKNETDERTNGNGSLMRIMPLICYIKNKPIHEQFEITWDVSALTHYHIRSAIACLIYLKIAEHILNGLSKEDAYQNMQKDIQKFFTRQNISKKEQVLFKRIVPDKISSYPENSINSSGYVLDSLEASIWCFLKYNNYRDTVLSSVNLGEDTDTTAAITGGLAGLLYSVENIPKEWINALAFKKKVYRLAEKLNNKYFSDSGLVNKKT